jgi:hypothetical protein
MFGYRKFEEWMAKVDAVLLKRCGLDNRDLPDWTYFDAFEDGYTPTAAAAAALRAAKEDA